MLNIVQNLSKRNPNMLTLRRAIQAPAGYKVVSVDSSQIEARMLAWLAGQHDLVEQFRHGRDPYSELAEKIFNVPWEEIKAGAEEGNKKFKMYRNVGKTAILSAGYGVGWRKYSDTLLRSGAKLHNDLDQHAELARNAHSIYRQVNANIVRFWDNCMDVIKAMEAGISGSFAGPNNDTFRYGPMPLPDGTVVPSVQMPSGFILRYPNLRWEANDKGRAEYMYDRPRGKNMVKTRIYGGAFCENLTQGISFQLLVWQACRMAEAGVPLACNVHDAWVAVVPESEAQHIHDTMMYWMSRVPDWMPGFPVACSGEIGDDYTVA